MNELKHALCLYSEMKSLGARIAYYRAAANMSQASLANACGWGSQSRIGNYEKNTREPTIGDIKIMAKAIGIPPEYILLDAPLLSDKKGVDEKPLPLLSWVQAGHWTDIDSHNDLEGVTEWYPCPVAHGQNAFALRVVGQSMKQPHGTPSFDTGDIIFFDPDREAKNGSLVVAMLENENSATFKQLVIDEMGKQYLQALNPTWEEKIIKINGDAVICGVVIAKLEVFK